MKKNILLIVCVFSFSALCLADEMQKAIWQGIQGYPTVKAELVKTQKRIHTGISTSTGLNPNVTLHLSALALGITQGKISTEALHWKKNVNGVSIRPEVAQELRRNRATSASVNLILPF